MPLLDQHGNPIPAGAIRRLAEEQARGTLAGVRPAISGHPADGLTPKRLAAIHRAAAQGDGLAYLELAEDIEERDLHYAGVLSTRKRQVAQLPITVEAASDEPEHLRHKELIEAWLGTGVLQEALFDILDAIGKGFSICEIMWRTEPGQFWPEALVFRPQRWFTVSHEDADTLLLRDGAGNLPLAPHKFLVHRHPVKSGLLFRSGLARVASWAWMYKAFTLRDWAVFVQNYGQPIRVGKYGPESSQADRDVLWTAVSNIAGDCAAIIPQSMQIEFITGVDLKDGSDLYEKRADWMDRQISKLVLGQTTTTDAISGGHAVAKEHRLVQEDIERFDATKVSTSITRQLVQAIVAFNFGPQQKYPTLRIGRPDEVPLEVVIEAVSKLVPTGLRVEASQIRDRLGLAEPAADAEVLGRAPVAAAGTPPAGPGIGGDRAPLSSLRALLVAAPEGADQVERLTERLALDAQGALTGLTERVRREVEAATSMQDLAARLAALQLDPTELAKALGQGMALAHLAGQAALLDELRG